MKGKRQEEMAKQLVELLIKADVFKEKPCTICVDNINTDMHYWITLKETMEKGDLIRVIKHAIIAYEGECLAKVWAKPKRKWKYEKKQN